MKGMSWIIGAKGEVEITYSLDGKLTDVKFSDDASDKQRVWVFDNIAMRANDIESVKSYMKTIGKKVAIKEVPADISFDRFWIEYGNKVGKTEAQKAWGKMSKANQTLALLKIKSFKVWSHNKTYDLPYPSKYLNKKRYEDDYN